MNDDFMYHILSLSVELDPVIGRSRAFVSCSVLSILVILYFLYFCISSCKMIKCQYIFTMLKGECKVGNIFELLEWTWQRIMTCNSLFSLLRVVCSVQHASAVYSFLIPH
jgi:hypothetical protein